MRSSKHAHFFSATTGANSELTPQNAVFVLVSFEGPDPYSSAGGLGVRVSSLAEALASSGFETHLFFIGDPALPGEEIRLGGNLILHRWCQWLSAVYKEGVYHGEEAKVADFQSSLPKYVAVNIIKPIVDRKKIPIVVSEEWQTARAAIDLSDELHQLGIRDNAILFWNANNPYSFDRIDWPRLAFTNNITAVSRYMRSIIRARGVDATVIPNGIPLRLVNPQIKAESARLRQARNRDGSLYFKMARWEREKGWSQALDAVVAMRERGQRATLVARSGGPTGGGSGLHLAARSRGLTSAEVQSASSLLESLPELAQKNAVIDLRFGVSERLAAVLYAACDGVLANSVSEPFGLVGLEAMAAGGVVYTGGTGEDYAVSGHNAVVLETLDENEIADRSDELASEPARAARMRRAARQTAKEFTWDRVSLILLSKAEQVARRRELVG